MQRNDADFRFELYCAILTKSSYHNGWQSVIIITRARLRWAADKNSSKKPNMYIFTYFTYFFWTFWFSLHPSWKVIQFWSTVFGYTEDHLFCNLFSRISSVEKWFEKSGSRNLVQEIWFEKNNSSNLDFFFLFREKWLTRRKCGFIL